MTKTVLLVDDQELILRVVQAALSGQGYKLPTCRSGQGAIDYITKHGAPDALILDYSMPDQDGVETLRQIRRLADGGNIQVMMLTARDQTSIRQAADGLKVFEFMTKPFSPANLQKTVKEMIEKTQPAP